MVVHQKEGISVAAVRRREERAGDVRVDESARIRWLISGGRVRKSCAVCQNTVRAGHVASMDETLQRIGDHAWEITQTLGARVKSTVEYLGRRG